MGKARWWRETGESVTCLLCPHACTLKPEQEGVCRARIGGEKTLKIPGYGFLTAEALDPIEKKPLYHFLPGRTVWSIGFAGCNMDCPFCQNSRIAMSPAGTGTFISPKETVDRARRIRAEMVAYTYSEPTIHIEYIEDTAAEAAKAGLKNVLVTNGCLNVKPARELLAHIDGVNIDLKSWNATYYRDVLGGKLASVKKIIEIAAELCWLEITTLVVPGDNDGTEEMANMCDWISSLSRQIPLHLSAYHPAKRYSKPPTSPASMNVLAGIAEEK
ncbi:MAG: AmmeMemoRadiSam system radical SAM enzyme, partial [Spirochaetaceae bacterium]|nr:AmmeMemoRadiSam system radical SAM enzyme [Spirochaetaceae bacterium]